MCFVLQACAGNKASEQQLPLAELPPAAAPSTRDCTPSRQRIGSLLPGTPQTAPLAAGNASQQMMSPPPKRLATAVRAPGTSLMSPPPARTRGNRKLVMGNGGAAGNQHQKLPSHMHTPVPLAAAIVPAYITTAVAPDTDAVHRLLRSIIGDESFTFSPAPRQPDLLLSPRGGAAAFSGRNLGSPMRPDTQNATAQGHQTPQQALRPNRLFDTPVASATPQQSSAARPNTHATPEAGPADSGRVGAAAAGVKVRKLTFDAARPAAQKAPAPVAAPAAAVPEAGADPPMAEAPKARGRIKFELGESAMAVSTVGASRSLTALSTVEAARCVPPGFDMCMPDNSPDQKLTCCLLLCVQLLKQVSNAEVKQEAAAKHELLEQQRALDMLPGSFEVLRSIYGERGPCVKPKAEVGARLSGCSVTRLKCSTVVHQRQWLTQHKFESWQPAVLPLLQVSHFACGAALCRQVLTLLRQKSTSKSGMSVADATEQLDLMLRLVPDFLRTITSSGASLAGLTQSVRINRQMTWPAARQKLLTGAAEARCSGSIAATQAVAAEQQREAGVAVAAASAVEVEDESSGSESEEEVFETGPVDDLGLDILAELDGNAGSDPSSSSRNPASKQVAAGGLADEALALLGGGSSSRAKGAGTGTVLSALSFKAPAKKGTSKR